MKLKLSSWQDSRHTINMVKTKEKKLKGKATEKKNPDNNNPFETNGDAAEENGDYPNDINPFLKKRTKSMKKAEKREKKREKMEEKARKKEEKLRNGGKIKQEKTQIVTRATEISAKYGSKISNNQHSPEGENTSSTLPPIQTSQMDSKPQERKVSQTLDNRSPSNEKPPLRDKRLMQLKTGMGHTGRPSSLPNMNKQITPRHSPVQVRPQSLEVKPQSPGTNRGVSPLRDNKTPSPLVGRAQPLHPGNEDFKMYRSSSISKKGKEKKKKKKLKRMLRRKKASKGKDSNLLEDQDIADQVVLRPTKRNRIEDLQREVVETQKCLRSSIINLAEQRNSQLETMLESVKGLEEVAHGFATVAQETRLKKQAGATCCGLWKNWKICWYICACQTGVKRKKKWNGKDSNGTPEAHELLSPRATADQNDDADDYYRPAADEATTSGSLTQTRVQVNPRPLSTTYSVGGDSVNSTLSSSIRSKLSKIPKSLMASLPTLVDKTPPMGSSLRDMAHIDPRERKSSSVNALHEIVKLRGAKKREERERKQREKERQQKEKDIEEFASQYQDEETRHKVEDLLKLDLDSPGSS